MDKLSLSQAWDECRMILVRDRHLYVAVALALVVLPQTVIGTMVAGSAGGITPLIWCLLAATLLVGLVAQVALNRLAIGPSTTVSSAIGRAFGRMPVLLGGLGLLILAIFIILIPIVMILATIGFIRSSGVDSEPSVTVDFLILIVAALFFAVFQLMTPIAAVERGGSLHLMTRSWALARGNYWRLFVFAALVLMALGVVLLASQVALGTIIAAMLGPPAMGNLSALLLSFFAALIQAVFSVVFCVMLARIYLQLAGAPEPQASVPSSGT